MLEQELEETDYNPDLWPMSHPAHTPRKWFTESGL